MHVNEQQTPEAPANTPPTSTPAQGVHASVTLSPTDADALARALTADLLRQPRTSHIQVRSVYGDTVSFTVTDNEHRWNGLLLLSRDDQSLIGHLTLAQAQQLAMQLAAGTPSEPEAVRMSAIGRPDRRDDPAEHHRGIGEVQVWFLRDERSTR